jgi:hypothetical protein
VGAFPKIKGLGHKSRWVKPVILGPNVPQPMGFTHYKAHAEIFHEHTQITRCMSRQFLNLLLKSGQDLMPISRHNFPPILEEFA